MLRTSVIFYLSSSMVTLSKLFVANQSDLGHVCEIQLKSLLTGIVPVTRFGNCKVAVILVRSNFSVLSSVVQHFCFAC